MISYQSQSGLLFNDNVNNPGFYIDNDLSNIAFIFRLNKQSTQHMLHWRFAADLSRQEWWNIWKIRYSSEHAVVVDEDLPKDLPSTIY